MIAMNVIKFPPGRNTQKAARSRCGLRRTAGDADELEDHQPTGRRTRFYENEERAIGAARRREWAK